MKRNFLLRTLGSELPTMNELRFQQFHHKQIKSFQELVTTSNTIRLHIRRSYLQCYKWLNALKVVKELDPLDYGYVECDGFLVPQICDREPEPQNFPNPCTCRKCFREKVCSCRVLKMTCCSFCKCSINNSCSDPY